MQLTELTNRLMGAAPFPDTDSAERAVATTLETLGYLLPGRLVSQLESELPPSCRGALLLGRAASVRDGPSTHGESSLPPAHIVEQLQEVLAVLGRLLPGPLVESLSRELPSSLSAAFEPRFQVPVPVAPHPRGGKHTLASGRPVGSHPLSEGTPGSSHPLSTSHPSRAQSESLSADNPHGSTKLSSARGTTQEREHETLAETHPKR